jgi:lipopolysaccharide export system permease protein
VQQIEQNGLMSNLFVYLDNGRTVTTWDAAEARFGRVDGLPVLTMQYGSMQRYSRNGVLEYFSFDRYAFDLSPFTDIDQQVRYKASDLYPTDLFNPSPTLVRDTGARSELVAEGHARLSAPLYCLVAMAMALAAIVGGQFSRTGYSLRIAKAAGLFLLVRIVGYGVVAASAWNGWLNVVQYLLPIAATAIAMRVLFRGLKPRRRRTWRTRLGLKAATA